MSAPVEREEWVTQEEVQVNGVRMLLTARGVVEIEHGPLHRIVDFVAELQGEGCDIPRRLLDVLEELQQPQREGAQL